MKHVLIIIAIFLICLTTTLITAKITESNPCQIIKCPKTGFITQEAQWQGTTEDGRAICICPNRPNITKYVSLERKY